MALCSFVTVTAFSAACWSCWRAKTAFTSPTLATTTRSPITQTAAAAAPSDQLPPDAAAARNAASVFSKAFRTAALTACRSMAWWPIASPSGTSPASKAKECSRSAAKSAALRPACPSITAKKATRVAVLLSALPSSLATALSSNSLRRPLSSETAHFTAVFTSGCRPEGISVAGLAIFCLGSPALSPEASVSGQRFAGNRDFSCIVYLRKVPNTAAERGREKAGGSRSTKDQLQGLAGMLRALFYVSRPCKPRVWP
mmetsp:Transcript_34318/g.97215  ORF Transcript_34318/g.97215 Transcript_34318/m.97215 type:complete len:257 (-) Transcript_34318:19-789(-)